MEINSWPDGSAVVLGVNADLAAARRRFEWPYRRICFIVAAPPGHFERTPLG